MRSAATHHLTLVAPFIKRNALASLLAQSAGVPLTVYTRWSVAEIAAGVSDLSVFDFLAERGESRLLLHSRLHAKLLLVDDREAAFGSANITDAALGFAGQPNAELTAILQPVPNRVFRFLLNLEREAVPATAELRQRFEEAARDVPAPWSPTAVFPEGTNPTAISQFPSFRDPVLIAVGE